MTLVVESVIGSTVFVLLFIWIFVGWIFALFLLDGGLSVAEGSFTVLRGDLDGYFFNNLEIVGAVNVDRSKRWASFLGKPWLAWISYP